MNKPRLTDEQRARGRELAGNAKLPWGCDSFCRKCDGWHIECAEGGSGILVQLRDGYDQIEHLHYIVHAANNYPAALDEIEELRGEVERQKSLAKDWKIQADEWRKTALEALDGGRP